MRPARGPATLALVALTAAACARARPAPPPARPVARPTVARPPDPAVEAASSAAAGRAVAERYRVGALDRGVDHARLWAALDPLLAGGAALRVREVGRSAEGRPLRAVTFGAGPTPVLVWSQMHGDEPTGTLALADLLAWLADPASRADPRHARLAAALTVVAVPMLNPDGARRRARENAAGVDINRDARRLATPEGRALAALADSLRPAFALHLHDQEPRVVRAPDGRRTVPVAVALLAPPAGADGAYGPARAAARLLAADLAGVLGAEVPGRVARYDDVYTPAAFGEWMQARGTSTVLVEAGTLPGDPRGRRLRAVHVVALVAALDAVADGRWRAADPDVYDRLPAGRRER
jgi:hypothetical protein